VKIVLQRWKSLGHRQRLFAGLLACAALVAIVFAVLVQRDTRVALFAEPLRTEQVAEVVERLAEWNVPFVALPDNVRVDAKRRNDVLLQLSLAGIPHAHLETSAEALAKAGPLTPQSVLDAQQRDGLAGDVASALRGTAGVEDARIIIAPAQPGIFADEASHAATASVRVSLKAGATLTKPVLEGMRQFVAAAIPGLDSKHVAILDDRGLALGDAPVASGADEGQGLQQSLQSALDLALGAAATVVRVRVSYDPRVRELHDVVRKPLGSRAIGTTTSDETYKSQSKNYTKRNLSTDGGSEVADERVETPGGRLERISVAIAVDGSRHLNLEKIRSLAKGTLGLVSSRGDSVSVEEVAFPRPAAVHAAGFARYLGLFATLAPSLVLALALVLAVRFGAQPIATAFEAVAGRIAVQRTTRTVASFPAAHVRGALANEPPHTAAAIISALPAATATAVLEMYPAEERTAIIRRMSRAAAPVVPDYETVLRRG